MTYALKKFVAVYAAAMVLAAGPASASGTDVTSFAGGIGPLTIRATEGARLAIEPDLGALEKLAYQPRRAHAEGEPIILAAKKEGKRKGWRDRRRPKDDTPDVVTPDDPDVVSPDPDDVSPEIPATTSGPIQVTSDGEVIENVTITSDGGEPGIVVNGHSDVVIRNVTINHAFGPGILASNTDDLIIHGVTVINTAAPEYGPHDGSNAAGRVNIELLNTRNTIIKHVYLEKGSSGIYGVDCTSPRIYGVEGHDFRGPFPRGQLVQFNRCTDALLDTFAAYNPGDTSWTEDVINAYGSTNPIIRNGYIEGINSPSGIGVLIENSEGGYGGQIENVDVRYYVNGAFSAATDSQFVMFTNVRAYDALVSQSVPLAARYDMSGDRTPTLEEWAGPNFRGLPTSGQEAFLSYNAAGAPTYYTAGYSNPRPGRIAWGDMEVPGGFHETYDPPRIPYNFATDADLTQTVQISE